MISLADVLYVLHDPYDYDDFATKAQRGGGGEERGGRRRGREGGKGNQLIGMKGPNLATKPSRDMASSNLGPIRTTKRKRESLR